MSESGCEQLNASDTWSVCVYIYIDVFPPKTVPVEIPWMNMYKLATVTRRRSDTALTGFKTGRTCE